jgi:hypothetical protein
MEGRMPAVQRVLLPGTAVFAMLWVTARACVQSITIDESNTYLAWVAPGAATHWQATANNHVLNSALMRLFVSVFGPYHLTLRMPALIGAAIYILAAWWLCRMIGRDQIVQWPLFLCLVYNPLVMDFLVAARGYGLALAFLTSAIAIAGYSHLGGMSRVRACALCSLGIALSVASNFAFAFVGAATLLLICLWAWFTVGPGQGPRDRARLLAACLLPGLAVSVYLIIPVVVHWPKGELIYGARSLGETLRSVVEASLFQLNPQVASPLLYKWLRPAGPWLPPLLGVMLVLQLAVVFRYRAVLKDARNRWLAFLSTLAAAAMLLSLAAHLLARCFFGLLLPKDRTGLYLVPLAVIVAGAAAAIRVPSRLGRTVRGGLLAALFLLGAYHVLCLRLTYFKEWYWDADVKRAYDILAYYNHTYGASSVDTSWRYAAALNFYRLASGKESFPEFTWFADERHPPGRQIYVLMGPTEGQYVKSYGLKTVYYGERSQMLVAIQPSLEAKPRPAP